MVAHLRSRLERWIARRERETELPNPIFNQPGWHGHEGIDYFTSAQQAYDTLHIGSSRQAARLQSKAEPPAEAGKAE